jgi:N6-adenosine-specific RNA methylase IME4
MTGRNSLKPQPGRRGTLVIKPDKDAREIGRLYGLGKISLVDSVKRFIEAGHRLVAKKAALKQEFGHGSWLPWLAANADVLGFETPTTAQMLMKLAAKCEVASHLDEATAITYSRQLWGNTDDPDDDDRDEFDLDSLLRDDDGRLTPKAREFIAEVKREKTLAKRAIREAREVAMAGKLLALPTKRYGVILADPPWTFVVGSDAWMSTSSPSNHFVTASREEIAALQVDDIAADDCVLFMWSTGPHLDQALYVMDAWGFTYKSQAVWVKDKRATGYWFRGQHELLLVGTRGDVVAPAEGTQWSSVIEAPRGRHSEKPDKAYELIEHHFPNLPKIELYARQRRPGWDSWGLEAPAAADDGLDIPACLRRAQA